MATRNGFSSGGNVPLTLAVVTTMARDPQSGETDTIWIGTSPDGGDYDNSDFIISPASVEGVQSGLTFSTLSDAAVMARDPQSGGTDAIWIGASPDMGDFDSNNPINAPASISGILNSYADNLLFGRLWIDPVDIDKGLITAASTTAVSVWNAYRGVSKMFNSIAVVSPGGTTIVNPTPYNLQPTADINVNITILKSGPTIQYTTYNFDIDAVVYPIIVRGTRGAFVNTGNVMFGLGL
jgi:hypothetical protein